MDLLETGTGQTPLDPDEMAGLIPDHLQNRAQLNEWESINIEKSMPWAFSRRRKKKILSLDGIFELHRRMFSETWSWAGQGRRSGKSIGVEPHNIISSLSYLLQNVSTWIEYSSYPLDECAYRFHHKLVLIHPFSNGNGRHARIATDMLLIENEAEPFSWGKNKNIKPENIRMLYLEALRCADTGDYARLSNFVRS